MMASVEIIQPIVALVGWTLIMWLWMYATRIPAIQAAKMKLDESLPNGQQMASLPYKVRWKADNYNHLMEQPTIFYAIAISLALLGEGAGVNALLAWAYVALRVVHSLFQALINKIEVRFLIYVLSNVPLFWLTVNALVAAF